jgi:phage-related minor tail protein
MTTNSDVSGGLRAGLADAESALAAFAEGPARDSADAVARAFDQAGARIGSALGKAAAGGKLSFRGLVQSLAADLSRLALQSLFGRGGGLGAALGGVVSRLPFFGARAAGGTVTPGGAFLVGERGPELFMPGQAGSIGPPGGSMTINLHFNGPADAESFRQSQGQIAAAIARAAAYGRRNL